LPALENVILSGKMLKTMINMITGLVRLFYALGLWWMTAIAAVILIALTFVIAQFRKSHE